MTFAGLLYLNVIFLCIFGCPINVFGSFLFIIPFGYQIYMVVVVAKLLVIVGLCFFSPTYVPSLRII